jgi:uncharacterized protein (TIGR02246 family)
VTPRESTLAFATAINAADLDAAARCFTRDACLVTPDATAINGREAIRPILAQLIAARTQISVEFSNALRAGDSLLAREHWRIRSQGAGDVPFVQRCAATLLLRRLESDWKLAILAPWGLGG